MGFDGGLFGLRGLLIVLNLKLQPCRFDCGKWVLGWFWSD